MYIVTLGLTTGVERKLGAMILKLSYIEAENSAIGVTPATAICNLPPKVS